MEKKVLVAYGTKYGATAEIAERIGQVLRDGGLAVDVLRANQVKGLQAYDAVVLGSGVYIGRWRKEATKFLKANQLALSTKAVWLFSSGPTGDGDPVELLQGWTFPGNLKPIADKIQPRDNTIFHGAIDVEKLSGLEKWMIKNVNSPVGDFRDWEAISAWAQGIGVALSGAS